MARKKISFPDYAVLRMDDPYNLMMITGLMTFDAPLDYDRLKATLEQSLLSFRRFRQRLVYPKLPFMRPYWEDDPTFNLDSHLIRVNLPAPGDQKALQDLISVLLSLELDYSHPLWEFYLVENYENRSALIGRLHHSIADGISLMQVLLSLAEPGTKPSPPGQSQESAHKGSASPTSIKTLKSTAFHTDSLNARNLWEEGKKIAIDPSHARRRGRQVLNLAGTVGRLALRWPDPLTVFKGPLGIEKRAAWSEPIALKDTKFIGDIFNGTVNDVILTAVAGALGKYIDSRGGAVENLSIRGFIPVNLRPIELGAELGNKFGLVFLSLPVGIDDPIERLYSVKQNMDKLKSSTEAVATYGILSLLGAAPEWVKDLAVSFFVTKGTAIMTNVPGIQTQLYLAGAPINTVMAWVPQSGAIALGVSIISYNGKVWLGIATDKALVPDPETIVAFFHTEFEEMRSRSQIIQTRRQESLKPLLSMLDEAIQNVEALLAETSEDEPDTNSLP